MLEFGSIDQVRQRVMGCPVAHLYAEASLFRYVVKDEHRSQDLAFGVG